MQTGRDPQPFDLTRLVVRPGCASTGVGERRARVNYIGGCNSVCRFRTRSCNNACEVVHRRPWGPLIHRVFECLQSIGQHLQSVGEGAKTHLRYQNMYITSVAPPKQNLYY